MQMAVVPNATASPCRRCSGLRRWIFVSVLSVVVHYICSMGGLCRWLSSRMLQHRPSGDVQALEDGYLYLFNLLSYIIYVPMEGLCRWLSSRMLQHIALLEMCYVFRLSRVR